MSKKRGGKCIRRQRREGSQEGRNEDRNEGRNSGTLTPCSHDAEKNHARDHVGSAPES